MNSLEPLANCQTTVIDVIHLDIGKAPLHCLPNGLKPITLTHRQVLLRGCAASFGKTKVAFAKLYEQKTPITVADLLNDRALPFFAF